MLALSLFVRAISLLALVSIVFLSVSVPPVVSVRLIALAISTESALRSARSISISLIAASLSPTNSAATRYLETFALAYAPVAWSPSVSPIAVFTSLASDAVVSALMFLRSPITAHCTVLPR